MKHILIYTILFFLSASTVQAQEIVTDRPDQTESAATVGKGNLQIETGLEIAKISLNRESLMPTSLFRLGLFEHLELRVASSLMTTYTQLYNRHNIGFSDLELGFKWNPYTSSDERTQIALISHLILPTGSLMYSEDVLVSSSRLAIARDIGERWSLGMNLGYEFAEIDDGKVIFTLAAGYAVNDKVGVYMEVFGESPFDGQDPWKADAGITYLIHERLQLDASFGFGEDMNYYACGLSWRLDRE